VHTLRLFVFVALMLSLVTCETTDIRRARERVLRDDLFTMRALINEFTLHRHRRPQSLNELVAAGYLKQLPTDPFTKRNDFWIVTFSTDPKAPGIKDAHSGSHENGDGVPYSTR
jgi:general secretion pathway protein G